MSMRPWPSREQSLELGCTCQWWGSSAIMKFDPDCPIWDRHRHPNERLDCGLQDPQINLFDLLEYDVKVSGPQWASEPTARIVYVNSDTKELLVELV